MGEHPAVTEQQKLELAKRICDIVWRTPEDKAPQAVLRVLSSWGVRL